MDNYIRNGKYFTDEEDFRNNGFHRCMLLAGDSSNNRKDE